ncbi:MAG: insulinase family protein [Magnetococcales bacterium]|nr:insulinase family protein [Magnetococcales bacterium]
MNHDAFELLHREPVATLNLTVESYRHRVTGARHLHLAADDPHNAFLVAFLTLPQDSTGIAHILEHTALCGSTRYPVRDPFFMMIRRSLSTFMNAFTASDWTAYPFASQSRKDFQNLLQVYLDAAFFPNLEEMDFAQEGWRLEFDKMDDPDSELLFKGVVFNEMKGAMSSPSRVLWEKLARHLFPTITYHHNSGGDPEKIPDLTWADLKAFHARHYHPSNAIFMTYGDIPAHEQQASFEELALSRFEKMPVEFAVTDEKRLTQPLRVEESYALDAGSATTARTHIIVGWLLDKSIDLETLLRAHLLSGVLLDNSSSPLLHALETTELGSAPSPACGLDDSSREMVFVCGVEGSEVERADEVESLVLGVLEKIAREGVDPSRVESVLHQLELSRREVGGNGYPYGLKMMLNALTPALHHGDPVQALALDPALEKLRQDVADPGFVSKLVQEWLLDNPHRVRLVLKPDTQLDGERRAREQARLAALKSAMSPAEKQQVIDNALKLKARQEEPDNPEVLPRVRLSDVPPNLTIPTGEEKSGQHFKTTWFDCPTNGLVYQQLISPLPDLSQEQTEILPLFTSFLTEVGNGQQDYLQTQAEQAAVCGGIAARAATRGGVDNVQNISSAFVVSGKALVRNHEPFSRLLGNSLGQARFDELPRLRELVAQTRAMAELKVTDNGHALAMTTATSGMSPTGALSESWGGMTAIKRLKTLDQALETPSELERLAQTLEGVRDRIHQAQPQVVIVGEKNQFDRFAETLDTLWGGWPKGEANPTPFNHPSVATKVRRGWATDTQVHFCAKAYPAVPYTHADASTLLVLGYFLKNGYLHRAIREQGGAYGAGAGLDADAGAFRFFSYRDPRLLETLNDFDRSLEWLMETKHEPRTLEEAILSAIANIDRPGSPAGEAMRAFHDRHHGKTPELRHLFRQRVLQVTLADMQRVGEKYFIADNASIGIVSHAKALDEVRETLQLEVAVL